MRRKFLLPALAACAMLAVGAPVASAAKAHTAKGKGNAAFQTFTLKTLKSHSSKLGGIADSISGFTAAFGKDEGTLAGVQAGLNLVLAGVPQITSALTQLQAGLVSLQKLATSTEYGIAQVFIAGVPAGGAFLATPDIPDAVQPATVTGNFVATGAGAITVRVGVRSAESDGTGASDPAASCRVTVVQGTSFITSIPNAAKFGLGAGSPPFWDIPTKSPQTSTTETSFPFAPISTDNLVDLTTGSNSTGTVANGAGGPYSVTLTCIDLTPSTTDPTA